MKKGKEYVLCWQCQSSDLGLGEEHSNLSEAIREFRSAFKGLYHHGGGYVALLEADDRYRKEPLLQWVEGTAPYGFGSAWGEYNPLENLGRDCDEPDCCWYNGPEVPGDEMCEDCQRAALDAVLEYLDDDDEYEEESLMHATYVEKDRCECGREYVVAEYGIGIESGQRYYFDRGEEPTCCCQCAENGGLMAN